MPLSSAEQQQVQDMIDASSDDQRRNIRAEAEYTLSQVNILIGEKLLTREERKAGQIAIEMLVRLESTKNGKSWFFRV